MPAATIGIARDEILDRLTTALAASAFSGVKVIFDDVHDDTPKEQPMVPPVPPGQPWLRALVRHSDGTQASLGGVNGKRRQEISGLVSVQVFTPTGDGQKAADAIVEVVLNGYRTGGATPSGVQFRSVRFAEVGKSGEWFQTNCLADFTYDQIR